MPRYKDTSLPFGPPPEDFCIQLWELRPRLISFAARYERDRDKRVELVDSVIEKLLGVWWQYRPESNMLAWAATAVVHKAYSNARRNKYHGVWDEKSFDFIPDNFTAKPEVNLMLERTLVALKSLSPEWQEAIQLVAVEGLTHKEVAERLGLAEGTIKSRLTRARARLKDLVGWDK